VTLDFGALKLIAPGPGELMSEMPDGSDTLPCNTFPMNPISGGFALG
jgi:hypothetical protein